MPYIWGKLKAKDMSSILQAINAEKAKGVTIRFELRTTKKDKDGKIPIRLIFQVRSERKVYNTGQSILLQCWDKKNQQAFYIEKKTAKAEYPQIKYELFLTQGEAKEFNDRLIEIINQTKAVTDRYKIDSIVFNANMVIEQLKKDKSPTTKKSEPTNQLFDFIDQYIEENTASRVPGSLTVYKSMKNHLLAYQLQTKKKVTFDKVDYSFFQSFQNFLIGRTKIVAGNSVPMLNNITIAKQLFTVKTFLNYAKMKGIAVPDQYKNFKIKKEETEVIALSIEEFESLYYLDLSNNKKLNQVRDVFCIACSTGLRYSDMKQLKREHIGNDEIKLKVIKTGIDLTIPLTVYSSSILGKYEAQLKPLPVISNQKMNDYVKDLCKLAGINSPIEIVRFHGAKREAITYPKYELIGCHTGRKTFVCLSLEKGMSAEQVMSITGHKTYQSFKKYLHVTEKLKKVVMLKAWGGELNTNKLKAV